LRRFLSYIGFHVDVATTPGATAVKTVFCAVIALSIAFSVTARADTNSWINGSGKWEAAGNWSLGVPPTNTQSAVLITNAASKTVAIDATTAGSFPDTMTVSNLTLSAPAGSTNALFLNNAGVGTSAHILNSFALGDGGALLVTNSSVVVGGVFDVNGNVRMLDGSLTATNDTATVGYGGVGDLTISDGVVQAQGLFVGTFYFVEDPGSGAWLFETPGTGTVTVAGGAIGLSSDLSIGNYGDDYLGNYGVGSVWITGGQLTVTNGTMSVANGGFGELTVSNGTLQARDVSVHGAGTVTIAGGTTALASDLNVSGWVTIDGGATTLGADLNVSGAGTAKVTGGQLVATNGAINVGLHDDGRGYVTVSGGTVLAGYVYLGLSTDGADSQFTVSGGSTTLSGMSVDQECSVWVTGGELAFPNGAIQVGGYWTEGWMTVSNGALQGGSISLGQAGELMIDGGTITLSADLGAGGSVWMTGGQLAVTNGTIFIEGDGATAMVVSNGTVAARDVHVGVSPDTQGTLTFAGGAGIVFSQLLVGDCNGGGSGLLTVDGGDLFVISPAHDASLEVANGKLILNSGFLWVDKLVMTNACGLFVRNGGTLFADELVLDPNLDADGDGVPNGFEQARGFDPLNAADGNIGLANSWIAGTGKWETSGDWSLGVPPFANQSEILVTNEGVNAVSIDALTSSNSPDTLLIRALTVSAPTDSTNTLLLSSTGTNSPLHVLGDLSLGTGGNLVVTNASLVAEGSVGISGDVTMAGGWITITNGTTSLADGQMTVSNGTVLARDTQVGGNGALTVAGGAVSLASNLSINGSAAVWVTGGQLAVTNGTAAFYGDGGQIAVSNGTVVLAGLMYIGEGTSPCDGALTIAGGTVAFTSDLVVDRGGSVNVTGGALVVTNGATTIGPTYSGGSMTVSSGTVAAVSIGLGPGYWGTLVIQGGAVNVYSNMNLGLPDCGGWGGWAEIDGGDLFVTNAEHNAVLEVLNGAVTLNSGILQVDRLVITNSCGRFVRNGGTLDVGELVLDPNLDADGDGMPNGWEQSHGFDPLDPADADADPDGDGLSNLQEYQAGTDPLEKDTDGDGMPDGWEVAHGLNPLVNDASADPDGDGFTNLQEYQAGTDPTNSASAFRIIDIQPADEDMLITWTAVGGKRYVLQTATNFSGSFSNDFVDLNPAFIARGQGETQMTVLHMGAATNAPIRFYRVRLVP